MSGDHALAAELPPPPPLRKYASRLLLLALYGLSSMTNAFFWIQFAAVVAVTQERYDVSAAAVNWLSLVFLFLYPPGTALALFLMERYGLRATLGVGAVLNAAAGWLRWLSVFAPTPHSAFALLLAGQSLAGLAQPIFLNLPTRIAGDWFPTSERDIGTVVGAMTNPLGNALGSVLPPLLVASAADLPPLLLGVAAWASALAVLVCWLVRDRPPTPPSLAAAARLRMHTGQPAGAAHAAAAAAVASELLDATLLSRDAGQQGAAVPAAAAGAAAVRRVLHDYAVLLRNRNFVCLLLAFGIGLGVFNAVLTLIAQLLAPCGYGADVAGFASGALLGAGLLGAAAAGAALELTRAYVPLLQGGMLALCAATVLLLASLRPGHAAFTIAAFGAAGLFVLPILPIALENAAETTYPIPEDTSAGLLMLAGQVFGVAFIFLMPALLAVPPSSDCSSVATPTAAVTLAALLVAAGAILFVRKDYRRQRTEAAGSLDGAAAQAEAEEAEEDAATFAPLAINKGGTLDAAAEDA